MKKNRTKMMLISKIVVFVILFYMSCNYIFIHILKLKMKLSNDQLISLMLSDSNHYMKTNYDSYIFVNKAIALLTHFELNNPSKVIGSNYGELVPAPDIGAAPAADSYNADELSNVTEYIKDPNPKEVENPKIYLYNTHQLENYNSANLELYNIKPNVMMTAYLLKDKLNEMGVKTIVEDSNITEFIHLNQWDYNDSYKASRFFMIDAKTKHASLEYYFDIHRDSARKDVTTKVINNRNYARILFVVGLDHPNYQKNLDFANKLNGQINQKYDGLSRGVMKKQGKGVNGIYNQDFSNQVMLIEIGGVDNTIEEVMNTTNVLSQCIYDFIGEEHEGI